MTLEQLIEQIELHEAALATDGDHVIVSAWKGVPEAIRAAVAEHKRTLWLILKALKRADSLIRPQKCPPQPNVLAGKKAAQERQHTKAELARQKRRAEYALYLATPHWANVRKAALERAGHQCQLCPSYSNLQVHHRTYKRLWKEEPNDVVVLCRPCHKHHHRVEE